MKKNDVFTFTAPNGVKVQAAVVDCIYEDESPWEFQRILLCYGQNRLFLYQEGWFDPSDEYHVYPLEDTDKFLRTVADYAVLPEYDELLQLHSSMEYPQWEQNLEAEIQGMNDR